MLFAVLLQTLHLSWDEHDPGFMGDILLTRPTHFGSMAVMGRLPATVSVKIVLKTNPILAMEPGWVGLVSRESHMDHTSCSTCVCGAWGGGRGWY